MTFFQQRFPTWINYFLEHRACCWHRISRMARITYSTIILYQWSPFTPSDLNIAAIDFWSKRGPISYAWIGPVPSANIYNVLPHSRPYPALTPTAVEEAGVRHGHVTVIDERKSFSMAHGPPTTNIHSPPFKPLFSSMQWNVSFPSHLCPRKSLADIFRIYWINYSTWNKRKPSI